MGATPWCCTPGSRWALLAVPCQGVCRCAAQLHSCVASCLEGGAHPRIFASLWRARYLRVPRCSRDMVARRCRFRTPPPPTPQPAPLPPSTSPYHTTTTTTALQLRNTTQLALDIGVQTPMGLVMEPQALGTLSPGGVVWLPAMRAHTGLLCVRPAAAGTAGPAAASAGGMQGTPSPAAQLTHAPSAPALPGAAAWQPGLGPSRIPSLAANSLAAAAALVAGPQMAAAAAAAAPTGRLAPTSPLLYPTSGLASPGRTSSDYLDLASRSGHAAHGAAGTAAPSASWHHPYEWSAAVPLQALLRQAAGSDGLGGSGRAAGAERNRGARPLACAAAAEGQPPVLLCMGAVRLSSSEGSAADVSNGGAAVAAPRNGSGATGAASGLSSSWEVLLSAPLMLHNALPVPAEVSLSAWGKPHRLLLQPNQHATLHAVDAAHVEHVMLRALGYHPTRPIAPPALPALADAGGAQQRHLHAQDIEVALQVSSGLRLKCPGNPL